MPVAYHSGMSATTIKLESELVKKVTSLKSERQSISGYVRGLIEREHQAREHRAAATAYQRFLDENPDERSAMEIWESGPLVDDVESDKP